MNSIIKTEKVGGDTFTVVKFEPPADGYIEKIDRFWSRSCEGFGQYVNKSLAGELLSCTRDVYFFGEIDGEIIARTGVLYPVDTMELGTLGFVTTAEEHRRRGISSILVEAALDDFRKRGGVAMHLATGNPIAVRLYKKCGFNELGTPAIMRYTAPGSDDFESWFYDYGGKPSIRPVNWGDIATLESLYSIVSHPWLIRDYPRGVWREERKYGYEEESVEIMTLKEKNLADAVVMYNQKRRVVGCAVIRVRSEVKSRISAYFDLFAVPSYFSELPYLVRGMKKRAGEAGIRILQGWIHPGDREKYECLVSENFRERGNKDENVLCPGKSIAMKLMEAVL